MNESQWISVKDRLPDVFPCVILDALGNNPYVPSLGFIIIKDAEHGLWAVDAKHVKKPFEFSFDADSNPAPSYNSRIIYWLPLPERPEK